MHRWSWKLSLVKTKADHRHRKATPSQAPTKAMVPIRLHLDPDILSLRWDTEWEAIEKRMAAHTNQNLPPFEDR
jgi:hypothetical protein